MPEVHVGAVLPLSGAWRMEPKCGRQFSITSFGETLPAAVCGIEKYLGSGMIKGIGQKFARRIVNTFGENTLAIIEDAPDRLLKVNDIGRICVEAKDGFVHEPFLLTVTVQNPSEAGSEQLLSFTPWEKPEQFRIRTAAHSLTKVGWMSCVPSGAGKMNEQFTTKSVIGCVLIGTGTLLMVL